MSSPSPSRISPLVLKGVIGFNGSVHRGIIVHPDNRRIIYPLGSTIVIKDLYSETQTFLQQGGHDRDISSLTISHSGRYLASGQITHMGFISTLIVWDLDSNNNSIRVDGVPFDDIVVLSILPQISGRVKALPLQTFVS